MGSDDDDRVFTAPDVNSMIQQSTKDHDTFFRFHKYHMNFIFKLERRFRQ